MKPIVNQAWLVEDGILWLVEGSQLKVFERPQTKLGHLLGRNGQSASLIDILS